MQQHLTLRAPWLIIAALAALSTARLRAVLAEFVIVTEDFAADQTTLAVQNVAEQVAREVANTSRLIDLAKEANRLAGDPGARSGTVSTAAAADLAKTAAELPDRAETLRTSGQRYHLNSAVVPLYNPSAEVKAAFEAVGQQQNRDAERYKQWSAYEAMYARYTTAVDNQDAVLGKERELNQQLTDKLHAARNHADIAYYSAQIAASTQRQELARQKAEQAKGQLDGLQQHLGVEADRKAEGDREWARAVIDHMRAKALEAYNAQAGVRP